LFYSRKNYKRPELQQEPHRTFADEAALLDAMFHGGWPMDEMIRHDFSMDSSGFRISIRANLSYFFVRVDFA
jgi:hypothetical protein